MWSSSGESMPVLGFWGLFNREFSSWAPDGCSYCLNNLSTSLWLKLSGTFIESFCRISECLKKGVSLFPLSLTSEFILGFIIISSISEAFFDYDKGAWSSSSVTNFSIELLHPEGIRGYSGLTSSFCMLVAFAGGSSSMRWSSYLFCIESGLFLYSSI